MGDWMTVHMTGTVATEAEVVALKRACEYDLFADNDVEFHPLSYFPQNPSLCGLNHWPAAERNYSPQDVADTFADLVKIAPSLSLDVHCGGAYEHKDCVATVIVDRGSVAVCLPRIERLQEIPEEQIAQNFKKITGYAL